MHHVTDVDPVAKKDEKKLEILNGARSCFATYGYDGATVARLEEATGKSRGAIFHHYPNKDALFLAVAHEDMKRMADIAAHDGIIGVIRSIMESDSLNDWWGMRVEIIRRVHMDPCFAAKWELDQLSLRDTVRDRLSDQQQQGRMRQDISVDTMAKLLEIVMEGVLAKLAQHESADDMPHALDLVEQLLRSTTP